MENRVAARLEAVAAAVFAGTPVDFAYLFGSQATGRTHPHSDVDVAVHLAAPAPDALELRLALAGRLAELASVGDVEVIVLNDAPLPLAGRALRDRVVIFSRDEPARVRYESITNRTFLDFDIHDRDAVTQYLRDVAAGTR